MWSTPAAQVLAQHLGPVHPVEQALTLLLAFGPFLVLGAVVLHRRRVEAREDAGADPSPAPGP